MGALRDFVADVLDDEGALVEPIEPDGLEVLSPPPLRAAMQWPELTRLGFGAELPAAATAVGLDGDWLERFGALLGGRGVWSARMLAEEPAPPLGDPERLVERALDLPNAIWRLSGVTSVWTRCLLLAFRYTAVSDEQREGVVWLGLNQGTGGGLSDITPKLREVLADEPHWLAPTPEARRAAGAGVDPAALMARVRPLLDHAVRREIDPFLRAMRRRLDRDSARVHRELVDYGAYLRIVRRNRRRGRRLDASLDRDRLIQRGNASVNPDDASFRMLPRINVRRMRLHADLCGASASESRYVAGEPELDRIHDTTFSGPIRTADAVVPAAKRELQFLDTAEVLDLDAFDLDHGF